MKIYAKCEGAGCTTPETEITNKTLSKPDGWVSVIVEPGHLNEAGVRITICPACFAKTGLPNV